MKILKHDGSVNVPLFNNMTPDQQKDALGVIKCECGMTGWWSRIDMENYNKHYPGIRCSDCKRVFVIESLHAIVSSQKYATE